VDSVHCGGCHTMVRAKPIPGFVYESTDDSVATPIPNGEEVDTKTFALSCQAMYISFTRFLPVCKIFTRILSDFAHNS
jgi:hypothetical protein